MDDRLNFCNKLCHAVALLLTVQIVQVLSQKDNSEEVDYDWSTFLLLVIPVLIILVVLVLCVTGVFMFCLSTLTMNYDQDYIGQTMGPESMPESKSSLPKSQLNLDEDLVKYRQSLSVLETVKVSTGDPSSAWERSRVSERTEGALDLDSEVEFEQKEEDSVSVKLGGRKLEETVIEMEPCSKQDDDCLDQPRNSELVNSSDSKHLLSKSRYPLLFLPASLPTLQQLKLEYYRPQSVFHSVETVGVRG